MKLEALIINGLSNGEYVLQLDKRKYKKKEVEELLDACKTESDNLISEYKSKISELELENKRLLSEVAVYKERDLLITNTLVNAEKQADELTSKTQAIYELEVERLKKFSERWKGYFNYITEKYPLYGQVKDAAEIYETLKSLLSTEKGKAVVDGLEKILDEKSVKISESIFNPKSKIEEYIAATSDSGFNLNEVLNPGELKLEDLCKELGLIDEK